MKYKILSTLYKLVRGQVNLNFQLVLNEMGPGRTSRAWYFHSPSFYVIEIKTSTFYLAIKEVCTEELNLCHCFPIW